jgi:adenylate cyclase
MKSFFRRLLNAGINPQLTYQETRTVSFLNGLTLLVLLLIVLNISYTLVKTSQTPGVRLFLGVLMIHWMLIALTLAFNFLKKFTLARIYFCLVAASFMTVYTILLGVETRWSFFLPIIIFLEFYIFPAKEKIWMYFIAAYCVICFVGLEIWFTNHQPLEYYTPEFLTSFKYFNTFGILFCAGAMGITGYNTINRAEENLAEEHRRSENLLLNILPLPIANRLKQNEGVIADRYENVTTLFADIVDFTKLSERIVPDEMVKLLNSIFSKFDDLADQFGLEKIKTIGDAYMVVAGLPEKRKDHAEAAAAMGIAMLHVLAKLNTDQEYNLNVRIGICSGPVVAGVIGKRKFSYDLWGDSVNTASRMESHGIPGEIQVTESTFQLLENKYNFDCRGMVEVKGKGLMKTYLLKDNKEKAF